MAALTEGRNTIMVPDGTTMVLPVAAGVTIYDGALVVINATGYAEPAKKAASLKAVGRAECLADNKNGEDGEIYVTARRGVYSWDNDETNAVGLAHVMGSCYIVDDHTVTSLATGSSVAGKVLGIEDDGSVLVETI